MSAVKHAIQQCGVQLKSKIARAMAAREQKQRKRQLTKYIPNTVSAIWDVLEAMAEGQPHGPKRRRLQASACVLLCAARCFHLLDCAFIEIYKNKRLRIVFGTCWKRWLGASHTGPTAAACRQPLAMLRLEPQCNAHARWIVQRRRICTV